MVHVRRTYPENKGRSGKLALCVASLKYVFVVSHEGASRSGVTRDGTPLRSVPDYERVGHASNGRL